VNEKVAGVRAKGHRIYGISYETRDVLNQFAKAQKIEFELLSDEGWKLIEAMELRDPQFTSGRADGAAIASVLIVESQGVVFAKTVFRDHDSRSPGKQIISLLNTI